MKKAGIVLIIIEAIAILMGIVTGTFGEMLNNIGSGTGIMELIGYLMLGIVGVVLLLVGINKEKKNG